MTIYFKTTKDETEIPFNPIEDKTKTLKYFGQRTQTIFNLLDYAPTPHQAPLLASEARYIAVTGGEQSGKSYTAAKKLVKELLPDVTRARQKALDEGLKEDFYLPVIYWLVGADYDATEREFGYAQDDMEELGWLKKRRNKLNPGYFEILGGRGSNQVVAIVKTKSAKDFKSLRKEAPSGIIGCEAAQLDLIAFERMRARTAPMSGWMFLAGTMEGSNGWFPQMAKQWGTSDKTKSWFKLKSASNFYLYPGGEDNEEIQAMREDSSDQFFKERFEGEPCPPLGVVFPEFRPDLHVDSVEYRAGYAVQLWEDPGYGDFSAHSILVVQIIEKVVYVIDEIYERGITTEDLIDDFCLTAEWWPDVETLVSDPHYSTQHHSTTSVEEIWLKKVKLKSKAKRLRLNPRIERIRTFLKPDSNGGAKMVIAPHCTGILSEVGMVPNPFDHVDHIYKFKTDKDGNQVGDEPDDKWNHSLEALGRGLVHNFGHATRMTGPGTDERRKFRSQHFGGRTKRRRRGTNGN